METKTEEEGCGSPVSACAPSNISPRERKMLSLKFIGRDAAGRYLFRDPTDPLKLVVTDYAEYWEIRMLRAQMRPVIDSEMANQILALQQKIEAIEPGFNPEEWLAERGL